MKFKAVNGPLPVKVQLAIFKRVRRQFEPVSGYPYSGICSALFSVARYVYNYDVSQLDKPSEQFPLFTRANAIEHAGAGTIGAYWWPNGDYESRRIFLDWIIAELKKHA